MLSLYSHIKEPDGPLQYLADSNASGAGMQAASGSMGQEGAGKWGDTKMQIDPFGWFPQYDTEQGSAGGSAVGTLDNYRNNEIAPGTGKPSTAGNIASSPTLSRGEKSSYGLDRPIVSGIEAGYEGDSGLDISAPVSTPVLAAAGGKVIYAEAGHTAWQRRDPKTGEPIDTPYSVLIELDTPITFKDGRQAKYIWYTHLSKLAFEKTDGDKQEIRVKPGQVIGHSGTANDSPHLHFGVLLNRSQGSGDYFTPDEVREMLGIKQKDKW